MMDLVSLAVPELAKGDDIVPVADSNMPSDNSTLNLLALIIVFVIQWLCIYRYIPPILFISEAFFWL